MPVAGASVLMAVGSSDVLNDIELFSVETMTPGSRLLWFNWKDIRNPEAGGAEVFTHEVAKRLVALGYVVTIFTSSFPGAKHEETIDGVRIFREGSRLNVHGLGKKFYLGKKDQFDIVIDEINTKPFMTPTFVDKPKVALIHQLAREYWHYEVPFPASIVGFYLLERHWLRKYLDVPTITVSRSTEQDLIGLGFRKLSIVREGLSCQQIVADPIKDPVPTVVYLGRLTRAKRVDLLLDAFKHVKTSLPGARLVIAGDGYLLDKTRKLAADGVTVLGKIPGPDVPILLQRAWVLAYPSVREGFGLSIIEANSQGTPAVGFDVPGVRDAIRDGETGILVPNGDVLGLGRAISSILRDSALRLRMSKNAVSYSRNFDWDSTSAEFDRVLTSVLQGNRYG